MAEPPAPKPAKAPVRGRPRWIIVPILAVLAVLTWFADQTISDALSYEEFREDLEPVLRGVLGAMGYVILLIVLGSYPNGRRLCLGFLATMLLSTFVTHALKLGIGRGRPQLELGPAHYQPFHAREGDLESFPSGHASAAAAMAVLMGMYFPRARRVFYAMAAIVGFERIVTDKHYLSDVLAGYAVGILAVLVCLRALGRQFYVIENAELRTEN